MSLSASIVIPRPPHEVFVFVSDVRNMPRWVTGVLDARLESPDMAAGARFTCEYRQGWRSDSIELQVTEYDPPHILGTRSSRAPFQFAGRVVLEEVAGGTRVSNTIEADADSLAGKLATLLFGPLLARSMRKRLARELAALQRAIVS